MDVAGPSEWRGQPEWEGLARTRRSQKAGVGGKCVRCTLSCRYSVYSSKVVSDGHPQAPVAPS